MSKKLVLYTNPMSRGRVVRWMLEELGVEYQIEVLPFGPAMKTESYLQINPMGKVPTLIHGDTVVTETAGICAYLADAFPEAGLSPHLSDRGEYYRWLFFTAGPLESALSNRSMGITATPEKAGMLGYGTYELTVNTLEQLLKHKTYVAGTSFTAADLYLAAHVGWGMEFGTLEKRPAFEAYWAEHSQRPAHKRATELDDALLEASSK